MSGQLIDFKKELVPIIKIDEVERVVKGVVYKPDELDAHDDWMTAAEIKKASYNFMKQLRLQNVDTKHTLEKVDAYVCESYIAEVGNPDNYPEGSWIVAMKIDDDTVWADVLSGEYEAFSMYGKGYAIKDVEPSAT
jgi:hypothetical protein